ncbi:phosphonate transport system permease protein [Roseomonas alkaliterrae]|uniref:Phosphonate transport system permease protein n=1 Tax=Neoroseomonas alkaliterrae TaxID=1452450 RepID=A0A840XS63_9PROT|nr:phosphonate transport system permease protein [Neoroseomonas alkaliterrae]
MTAGAVLAAEGRWRAARTRRWRAVALGGACFAAAVLASAWIGEVSPARLVRGLPLAWDYIHRTLPEIGLASVGADIAHWMWGFGDWVALLGDTLLIAYVGTVLGAAAALLLSFPAASTLAPGWVVGPVRRLLEFMRTVPTLVLALVFVYAFGLGPFAGVLAIAVHSAGALGKLFAEEHENVSLGPVEAVRAAGGSWPAQMRFGVLPQSLPGVLSYGLLRFEINVREASVLGIVGAGGIGEELYLAVRQFEYQDISAILVLILATVAVIDVICGRLRRRVIGVRA